MRPDGLTILRRITQPERVLVHDRWGQPHEIDVSAGAVYVQCVNGERAVIYEQEQVS